MELHQENSEPQEYPFCHPHLNPLPKNDLQERFEIRHQAEQK